MSVAERLAELGITLPPVFPPAGNYVGCVIVGDMVHVGGHGPVDGATIIRGKVGSDLSLSQARRGPNDSAVDPVDVGGGAG